jgi:Ankyrin repeats (3 copies)/Ankyrin repeat
MLAQDVPFPNLRAVNRYCSGRLPFPAQPLHSKNITENGVTFVRALLDPQPHQRMTAESASQHDWLQSVEPDPPITGDSQSTVAEDDTRKALPQASSQGLVTKPESDILTCRDTELQRASVKLPDPIDPDSSIGSSTRVPRTMEKPSHRESPQGQSSFHGNSISQLKSQGRSPSATSIAVQLENTGSVQQPASHGSQRSSSLSRHGSVNEASLEGIMIHPTDALYNSTAFSVSTSSVETLHSKASTPKPETEIADVILETHKIGDGELPHSGDTNENDADIDAGRVIDLGPPEDAGQRFLLAAQEGLTEVLGAYLDEGFNIDFFDVEGKTALHYACDQGDLSIMELLLEAGCNVNAQSHELITPLHMASGKGRRDILEHLLKFGANVNAEDKYMKTPLHWAVYSRDEETVRRLVNAGADLLAQDAVGSSPSSRARRLSYWHLAQLLENAERDQLGKPTLPAGWEKKLTVTGKEYYINHHTNGLSLAGPGLASAALAASLRFQGYKLVYEVDHLWLKGKCNLRYCAYGTIDPLQPTKMT